MTAQINRAHPEFSSLLPYFLSPPKGSTGCVARISFSIFDTLFMYVCLLACDPTSDAYRSSFEPHFHNVCYRSRRYHVCCWGEHCWSQPGFRYWDIQGWRGRCCRYSKSLTPLGSIDLTRFAGGSAGGGWRDPGSGSGWGYSCSNWGWSCSRCPWGSFKGWGQGCMCFCPIIRCIDVLCISRSRPRPQRKRGPKAPIRSSSSSPPSRTRRKVLPSLPKRRRRKRPTCLSLRTPPRRRQSLRNLLLRPPKRRLMLLTLWKRRKLNISRFSH